jgi:hypothetical protein
MNVFIKFSFRSFLVSFSVIDKTFYSQVLPSQNIPGAGHRELALSLRDALFVGLQCPASARIAETFYQLTPWHPLIKAASAKKAIARTYLQIEFTFTLNLLLINVIIVN